MILLQYCYGDKYMLIKHSKIIHVIMFLMKNSYHVLTFIQIRIDENKFWQIRSASGNVCVQLRVKRSWKLS